MSHMITITNKQEYDAFTQQHDRCVIFYGAPWCGACTVIKDLYVRIANRYHHRVALAYVDTDECKLNFGVLPVFVSLRKGEEFNSMEGADKRGLKDLVREIVLTP